MGVEGNMVWKRWTPEELELISWAVDNGKTPSQLRDIFPDRSAVQIQNSLNAERRKRKGACICGKKLPEGERICEPCQQRSRAYRRRLVEERLAQGLCSRCQKPIDEEGSTTLCSVCNGIQKRYLVSYKKPSGPKELTYNLLGWPRARAGRYVVAHLPDNRRIVDLFGGSGSTLALAGLVGNFNKIEAYSDAHPLLGTFLRVVCQGDVGRFHELVHCYKKRSDEDLKAAYQRALRERWDAEWGAAVFFTMARRSRNMLKQCTRNFSTPTPYHKQLDTLRQLFTRLPIHTLDYRDAIKLYDTRRTVFLIDPPWPGAPMFEHNCDYHELMDALLDIKGNFVVMTSSSRLSIEAFHRAPHLYYRFISGLGHELLASSFRFTTGRRTRAVNRETLIYLNQ